MRGSRVLTCASLRTIEFDQGDGDGTSVLRFDHEPLGSRADFLREEDKAQLYHRGPCWASNAVRADAPSACHEGTASRPTLGP